MKKKYIMLLSLFVLIVAMATVSAADSDNSATNDNSGSDVAVDSNSVTTAQSTETSTHTDSSVDKTSDASTSSSSSQKSDVTSQQATQKVNQKTNEKTQTTSDTTTKASSDTSSQSTQSTSQSTQQAQSSTNTTNENTNTVSEKTVDTNKVISTDDVSSEADSPKVWNVTDLASLDSSYLSASSGDILNCVGNFSSFTRSFYKNLTITSYASANFTNVTFSFVSGASGSTISNLYFDNSANGRTAIDIVSGTSYITITNNTFIINSTNINGKAISTNGTNNIKIINNDFTISVVTTNVSTDDIYAIGVFNSSNVNITNNNIRVNNSNVLGKGVILNGTNSSYVEYNNISVSALSDDIDWSSGEGVPNTYSLGIFGSSNIFARYNNIECYGNSSSYYSTVVAVSVQGSNMNSQKATYDYIMYNNITVQDKKYAYGVYLQYNVDSCYVNYNNITSINKEGSYAAGVNEYSTNNLNIMGNNITLDIDDTAYGIVLTGDSEAYSSNKAIMSNTINATSNRTRGIELYYVNHTLVQSNSIIVNGNYTEGICGGSTLYTNITKNRIMVNGVYTNSTHDIDEIPLVNTGIILTQAAYENKTNIHSSYINNITGNYIYSYGNSTIFLSASYTDVENNQLTLNRGSYILYGDETVYNNGTNNTIENNTGYLLSGSQLDDQTLAVTHVITQDNYEDYFIQSTDTSEGGLSDYVNDGDILDFQGTLNLTDKSLVINKAVNITSTTGDSLICLNTEAGSLLGDNQGQSFVVNNGGSYSNITNVNFWGTQLWITNASYVVFDNISAIVNGTRVGSGVGQTSIRPGCEYITIKNSYFYTADNGGSSTVVIAGGKYCTIDNNTVEAEGTSGNIIYLTTYNADLDGIDDFNSYNNITNNHVICNGDPASIRWGIVLTGHDNNVINNTIDYPQGGLGITQQWNYDGTFNTTIINNTCVNCGQSNIPENSTVYGNTFSEVQISAGSTFYNNTVNSIRISGDGCIIENNTILSDLTLNTTNNLIENNIFNVESTSINLTAGNNTFKNNQITGNASIILNGNSTVLDNNVIEGNAQINITGSNNTLKNLDVNGSASFNVNGDSNIIANNSATKTEIANSYLTINGSDNIVENNTIYRITNDLTIIPDSTISISANSNNNIVRYNDLISYDLIRGSILIGDDSVYVTDGTTGNIVQDNYGNISEIVIPGEGNYTYITYNVTSMAELISTLDDIKTNATYSNDTKYVINLLDGDYTVTEAITWGNGTGDVKEVIINGTGQTINGNGFNSTFLSIANGYSLTLDNVTFTDFSLDSSVNTIVNDGNLTINNSVFDAGIIASENGSNLFINNTNFTQTAINNTESATRIDNSRFYDTDLSSLSIALIHNTGGNLTFFNNYVSNITATYFMNNEGSDPLLYMENNDISYLSCSIVDILNFNSMNILNTMINNTFSNINSGLSINQIGYFLTVNNTYNNCSIPTNITSIPNTTLTTDEFTTVVTVTSDIAYNTTVTDGQIVISINGVEYKSFDVINGSATITIESSAFTTRINSIEVAYEPTSDNFRGSTTIFNITDPNVQSIMEYNVTSFEELKEALENAKTNTDSTEFIINLLDGDYTVTETLTWGDTTNDIKEITINGNGQAINLNGSTFIDVKDGYHLIINNVTIQNNEIVNKNSIENDGNLTIENSTFINAIIHSDKILTISYSNFTNTVFDLGMDSCTDSIESNANISNNYFYNTDVSQFSDDYKGMIYSHLNNLTFYNNTVENITGKYIIYNEVFSNDHFTTRFLGNCYIHNNTFKNIDSGLDYIYSDNPEFVLQMMYQGGKTEFIDNTIINATNDKLFDENQDLLTSTDYTTIENNTFIECNLDVSISSIPNTTTSEDFTTTVNITTTNSLYKTTVNDGQIIVSINGKEYKTFDVSNGQATITIETDALEVFADNNIEVQYVSQDGSFKNATTTFTLTYKLDDGITITINQTTIYSGDTITLTAEVVNNESLAKDGYVIFKVNGKTVRDEDGNPIMVQVDENGKASLNYTIPDTNSNIYNITAVYNGENTILRSTPETITTTLKTATITVDQITAKAGQTVTLTAYITDQNGNAVNSGKLIFKLNGKTLKDANGNTLYATIVNGIATLKYTIPDNYSAKDYILTAVYQGTGFERSEANSTLTLTKSTPTIIPDSSIFGTNNTITITQGQESVNIKATIIDPETNAPIDTTTVVTIKINDKTVTQQYVSNGQIDMTIYTSSFKNPEYNITVVVGENSQYARTSYEATLEIVSPTSLKTDTSYNGTLEVVSPVGLETSNNYNGTLLVKED